MGGSNTAKSAQSATPQTIKQSLENRKAGLEAELAKINEALSAFEKYPEVGSLIDYLRAAGYGY